jgi:K+-transporting ATPase ATPase C chain
MSALFASLRVCAATLAVCVVLYPAVILGTARTLVPHSAAGSLILRADGTVVGSRLIAQGFSGEGWFWPRPSAVDYNGSGAGGSNTSPTNPVLTERAQALIARHGATPERPLPPELATASGSGLDPHLSEHGARWQVPRVARARGSTEEQVALCIDELAFAPGGPLTPGRIVNVLELNLLLDVRTQAR